MDNCIFCKIIKKEIPSEIVYENDKVVAFNDIRPISPVHLLIVPKEHIESIKSRNSEIIAKELIKAAKEIALQKNLQGYKLLFNVGREGGQIVDHLHLHLLAGRTIHKKEILSH